ncbi:hypothetical protein AG1IA_09753 [Rhizoctonia solani AG-1 IA]|uniref:Uncharacterized protein n=1 Tax=Thanatephorus cucumeris (strain AG1-IA) TaxID=983506 RepID=L8WHM0_THACA|nr:hypothetical protein AG1IA_09753 [Rhizoctonia solani AG-1 IA]
MVRSLKDLLPTQRAPPITMYHDTIIALSWLCAAYAGTKVVTPAHSEGCKTEFDARQIQIHSSIDESVSITTQRVRTEL